MEIQQDTLDGVTVIAPVGRVDTTTSGSFEDVLRRVLDGGARSLLVDFGQVDYISSAGLRVCLVVAKRLRELHGRLVLCSMREPVRQVFHLAGFMPLFTVESSRDRALTTLASPP